MALKSCSEFQELDDCLLHLKELQKSFDIDFKQRAVVNSKSKNEIKQEWKEILNKDNEKDQDIKTKTGINSESKIKCGKKVEEFATEQIKEVVLKNKMEIKNGIEKHFQEKSETKTNLQQTNQICTDLDQLIRMMKESEKTNDENIKSPERIIKPKISSYLPKVSSTNSQTATVPTMKNLKLEEHNRNLSNRFGPEKKIAYYSSLPKIVFTDEDCFTLAYKSSSQTNLSQPTSDYKIPFTVYQPNRTMKTILIDEHTTAGEICQLLTARNYLMPSFKFSLVEKTSSLKIERIFEDDETPVLCLLSYPDGTNSSMVFFEDREDKYGLFTDPGKWLGSSFVDNELDKCYIREIFSGPVPQLPRYNSHLFYRKIHRKTWKRSLCTLRNSGLYAYKKSNKNNSADLELIISIHPSLHLYTTIGGWSQSKAPTPYGFCLKTYGEQNPKYITYFCAPSEVSLRYWSSMFRIALKGKTLLINYQSQLQFVASTLNSFQELNQMKLLPHLSKSLGCVTGRSDLQTDL